jgi:hypothetical protein
MDFQTPDQSGTIHNQFHPTPFQGLVQQTLENFCLIGTATGEDITVQLGIIACINGSIHEICSFRNENGGHSCKKDVPLTAVAIKGT